MYDWDLSYRCHHSGCRGKFASAAAIQVHIKAEHPQHFKFYKKGTKPIYRMKF